MKAINPQYFAQGILRKENVQEWAHGRIIHTPKEWGDGRRYKRIRIDEDGTLVRRDYYRYEEDILIAIEMLNLIDNTSMTRQFTYNNAGELLSFKDVSETGDIISKIEITATHKVSASRKSSFDELNVFDRRRIENGKQIKSMCRVVNIRSIKQQ